MNVRDQYELLMREDVERMQHSVSTQMVAAAIVAGGAIHIRDIAAGEPAYHYSSGNFGPGYVSIKNAVGNQKLFKFLVRQLALRIERDIAFRDFAFIAGLVTGGVPPALLLRDNIQQLGGREIGFCYIRDTRKAGGTREHVTGILDLATGGVNPEIPTGSTGVVVEELTNFANSITNGANVLRSSGYECRRGFSILDYNHEANQRALAENNLQLTSLITLRQLLDGAEDAEVIEPRLINDYRSFLDDPAAWMKRNGYEKQEHVR